MSRLPEHVIDDVRTRIDLVDIVSDYVNLRRSGRRYKGLCPFHNEKTPSFHVDQDTQLYYCFGCHAGGNVFNFLTEMEKLTFTEAVRRLAERAGIPLEKVETSPEEAQRQKERLLYYRANEIAKDFFVRCLFSDEGAEARNYLKRRGLTKETVTRFEIGFAPDDWDRLGDFLESQGIPKEIAVKAGVLGQGKQKTYAWFRNRIMFPIADLQGRIVAFGGRLMSGEGAKYINTSDTPVFSKGRHLFGINVAVQDFRHMDHVVLVEGYMDVVGLYQGQFGPALASLGTAFTPEQARLIKRFTTEVVLAYDADGAGRQATLRGLDVLEKEGLTVRVAQLPEGEDPDSFIHARGKEAFQDLVVSAIPLMEYRLEEAVRGVDVRSVDGQMEAVGRVLPILKAIDSPVAKQGYVEYAAQRIGVTIRLLSHELAAIDDRGASDYGTIRKKEPIRSRSFSRSQHNLSRSRYTNTDFVSSRPNSRSNSPEHRNTMTGGRRDGAVAVEAQLLTWILKDPKSAQRVKVFLGESPFVDARYNKLFVWLLEHGDQLNGPEDAVSHMYDLDLSQVAGELLARDEELVGPFEAYLKRVIEDRERRQLQRLEAKLGSLMKSDLFSPYEVGRLVFLYKDVRERLKFSTEHVHAS